MDNFKPNLLASTCLRDNQQLFFLLHRVNSPTLMLPVISITVLFVAELMPTDFTIMDYTNNRKRKSTYYPSRSA